jgi:hypothetical protein
LFIQQVHNSTWIIENINNLYHSFLLLLLQFEVLLGITEICGFMTSSQFSNVENSPFIGVNVCNA